MNNAMVIVQLTSSRFFGSVERQMLDLTAALPNEWQTVFISFAEGGLCRPFLDEARRQGREAVALTHDTPHLCAAGNELTALLRQVRADVVCCHGYKADLLGWRAARRVGIPVVAVSHGWTGENRKVRFYERLDRIGMRFVDRVVCVSAGQAVKVRAAGVASERVVVIRDAVRGERFAAPDPHYLPLLRGFFPEPPARIVGAAGRLSPEKGFRFLVDAAADVVARDPSIGFVLFGAGPLREALAAQIAACGLQKRFVMAGFRTDLDRFLPHLDLLVLPSFTEGLPNVILEAFAAGVPVVATAVGGTPEIVQDGVNGYLVPPGDHSFLAQRILQAASSDHELEAMGSQGRERVVRDFTFAAQGRQYQNLFNELTHQGSVRSFTLRGARGRRVPRGAPAS